MERNINAQSHVGGVQGNSVAVEVDLQNLSGKTITGYDVLMIAHYPDGSEASRGEIEDVLVETTLVRMPGVSVPSSRRTLNSYEVRHLRRILPVSKDGSPPTEVDVRPAAIVFEDRTAIGSQSAIQAILDWRRQTSEDDAYVLAVVRAALGRPEVQSATGAAQAAALRAALGEQIGKLRNGSPQSGAEIRGATILQSFYDLLANGRLQFDMMVSALEAAQHALAEHSTLEVTK